MKKQWTALCLIGVLLFVSACRAPLEENEGFLPSEENNLFDSVETNSENPLQEKAPAESDVTSSDISIKTDDEQSSAENSSSGSPPADDIQTPTEESNETNNQQIHVRFEFQTLEEFINTLEDPTEFLSNYVGGMPRHVLMDLDHIYVPDLNGYELNKIIVYAGYITYAFCPIGASDQSEKMVVQYHFNYMDETGKNAFELYGERYNISLNEEGIYYNPNHHQIAFSLGEEYMSLSYPEDKFSYEQLRPYCVATKYTIGKTEQEKKTMFRFDSLEDLSTALEDPTAYLSNYVGKTPSHVLTDLDQFYVPNINGHEITGITVYRDCIFYEFYPIGDRSYRSRILAQYYFADTDENGKTALERWAEQYSISSVEDEIYYSQYYCTTAFSLEEGYMLLYDCDNTNYGQLKPYCSATKYTVGNGDSSLVTK